MALPFLNPQLMQMLQLAQSALSNPQGIAKAAANVAPAPQLPAQGAGPMAAPGIGAPSTPLPGMPPQGGLAGLPGAGGAAGGPGNTLGLLGNAIQGLQPPAVPPSIGAPGPVSPQGASAGGAVNPQVMQNIIAQLMGRQGGGGTPPLSLGQLIRGG